MFLWSKWLLKDSTDGWGFLWNCLLSWFRVKGNLAWPMSNKMECSRERLSLSCQSGQALITQIHRRTVATGLSSIHTHLTQLLEDLHYILQLWRDCSDVLDLQWAKRYYVTPTESSPSRRGWPWFQISREELQLLCSLSFSWTAIADMLMVSRITVYQRRAEYGMLVEPHSSISDQELTEKVQQILVQYP